MTRNYEVIVDNISMGEISNGETKEFEVTPMIRLNSKKKTKSPLKTDD